MRKINTPLDPSPVGDNCGDKTTNPITKLFPLHDDLSEKLCYLYISVVILLKGIKMKNKLVIFTALVLVFSALSLIPKSMADVKNQKNADYQPVNNPYYLMGKFNTLSEQQKKSLYNEFMAQPSATIPLYYVLFAENTFKTNKNQAAFLFMLGKYLTVQDAYACQNVMSRQAIAGLQFAAPKTAEYITSLSDAKLAKIVSNVLDWETQNPKRPSPEWICMPPSEENLKSASILLPNDEIEKNKADIRKNFQNLLEQLKSKN